MLEEENYDETENRDFIEKIFNLDKKIIIGIITLIIIIGFLLTATNIISLPQTNKENDSFSLSNEQGVKIHSRGSITTKNGNIKTFSTDGDTLNLQVNIQ